VPPFAFWNWKEPMPQEAAREEALERRLREGDASALADLFALHERRLWQLVSFRMHARLRQRLDPEDVLQETWTAAAARVRAFAEGDFASSFLWLRLVTLQTLNDLHRRHLGAQQRDAGRELALEHNPFPEATSMSLAAALAGSATSPSRAAMRQELVDEVQKAIGTLQPGDQEILALRHFEELTNGEAARVLGIQEKAASIRYVRALQRLKHVLDHVPGFFGEDRRG
jgi:RNA polymerase sigma-70 factor (ECF subfamily)